MKFLITMVMGCLTFCSFASPNTVVTAKRQPFQPYQEAMQQAISKSKYPKMFIGWNTPYQKAVPYDEISFENVPKIDSYENLIQMFMYVRNKQFLVKKANNHFLRRISWLYPDDGCFARAAAMEYLIHHKIDVNPAKIFAFGNLTVQTPYSRNGRVSWWYHVAPIVAYQEKYYVLDPAIEPNYPMLVEDWFAAMNLDYRDEVDGVVCHPETYDAVDDCLEPKNSEQKGLLDEQTYLKNEWHRMEILGYDPIKILGNSPPWNMP